MIISFAWTTPAVAIRQKHETRRDWSRKQIELARRMMESQAPVDAWTKSPRFHGEPFGKVLITDLIEQEDASTIPDEAWMAEGFHTLTPLEVQFQKGYYAPDVWFHWKHSEPGTNLQTVVKFDLLELNDLGDRIVTETVLGLSRSRLGPMFTLSDLRESVAELPEWRGI